MVALSCYCYGSSLLRNSIAIYELWFFSVIFQKNCQEKIWWICHSLRHQKIFSLCLSNSSFSWWKWINKKIKKSRKPYFMPFLVFRRDHLWFTSGIICGPGSFAVQFGDHFRSGDHLRSAFAQISRGKLDVYISTKRVIFLPTFAFSSLGKYWEMLHSDVDDSTPRTRVSVAELNTAISEYEIKTRFTLEQIFRDS